MRGFVAVAVLACTLSPLSQAAGQRWGGTGVARAPQGTQQDTSRRRSRDAAFVDRAITATLVNAAILAPTVVAYQTSKSETVLITGVVAQLMVTPFVAARIGDNGTRAWRCSAGGRAFMAFGGALMGLGGSILFSEDRYQAEHPHTHEDRPLMRPFGVAALALGVPLGAAAALYDCR